jgi:hypothetical protein
MIGFGICVGPTENLEHFARPGIVASGEPASPVFERRRQRSIALAYNSILVEAADQDLDALVLIHDDVELRDPDLGKKLRLLFSDPEVALVGAVGARRVNSLAWWWGDCFGRAPDNLSRNEFSTGVHEVETIDGMLLALSPWAVRTLRFDSSNYPAFHGYDADICMQARALDRKVVVADIDMFHHNKGGGEYEWRWHQANMVWQRKWLRPPRSRVDRLRWQVRYQTIGPRYAMKRARSHSQSRPSMKPRDS